MPKQRRVRVVRDINWDRIERFIGYGRRDAPVVFIGLEEGLSSPSALRKDLRRRSAFKAIENVKAAHKGIEGTEQLWREKNPRIQRTWRPMCHLMLAYVGRPTAVNKAERAKYQANELGSSHGQSLLMELLPYPHVSTKDWSYKKFKRFDSRKDYESALLSERISRLAKQLAAYQRKVIVCYGKTAWPHFKHLISRAYKVDINWREDKTRQALVAKVRKTRIVLVHHFSGKRFNSEKQLRSFARLALG